MRYIDADLLQEDFKEDHGGKRSLMIDTQPTADVRENVRAEIVHAGGEGVTQWFKCSECGTPVDITDNFCRCCGADMRGDKQ